MYSSIAGSISISAGWSGIALMCAFIAMLVLSQGMRYTTVRSRGVSQQRIAMTADWTTPDPQPGQGLIEKCRKNNNKQQTRDEYIIRQTHWFGPDDRTGSEGYMLFAGADALKSRVWTISSPVMILHGLAGSENSHETVGSGLFLEFKGRPPKPVEKNINYYIRCRAIKQSDGERCEHCLHVRNDTGFCGQHRKWPTNGGEIAEGWAVDRNNAALVTGNGTRDVETDKNNLKF